VNEDVYERKNDTNDNAQDEQNADCDKDDLGLD
jgi:hypothetical protein